MNGQAKHTTAPTLVYSLQNTNAHLPNAKAGRFLFFFFVPIWKKLKFRASKCSIGRQVQNKTGSARILLFVLKTFFDNGVYSQVLLQPTTFKIFCFWNFVVGGLFKIWIKKLFKLIYLWYEDYPSFLSLPIGFNLFYSIFLSRTLTEQCYFSW